MYQSIANLSENEACIESAQSSRKPISCNFHDPGILKWLRTQQTQRDIKDARHLSWILKHASANALRRAIRGNLVPGRIQTMA